MTSGRPIRDARTHFEGKVILGHPGGHWSLATKVNSEGYHVISIGGGEREYGHRTAYRLYVEEVPHGLDLDHLCRTRWCVNPAHLEPVTRSENLRRAYPECARGHDLRDPAVFYMNPSGRRICRPCQKVRNDARRAARCPGK